MEGVDHRGADETSTLQLAPKDQDRKKQLVDIIAVFQQRQNIDVDAAMLACSSFFESGMMKNALSLDTTTRFVAIDVIRTIQEGRFPSRVDRSSNDISSGGRSSDFYTEGGKTGEEGGIKYYYGEEGGTMMNELKDSTGEVVPDGYGEDIYFG